MEKPSVRNDEERVRDRSRFRREPRGNHERDREKPRVREGAERSRQDRGRVEAGKERDRSKNSESGSRERAGRRAKAETRGDRESHGTSRVSIAIFVVLIVKLL